MSNNYPVAPDDSLDEVISVTLPVQLPVHVVGVMQDVAVGPMDNTRLRGLLGDIAPAVRASDLGATAEERRLAVRKEPDMLLSMVEGGWSQAALTALFGFRTRAAFKRWVDAIGLTEAYAEAYADSADTLVDYAIDKFSAVDKAADMLQDAMQDVVDGVDSPEGLGYNERAKTLATCLTAITSTATKRVDVAMRLAAVRNRTKYAPASAATSGITSAPQNVSFNISLGGAGGAVVVTDSQAEVVSLPPGVNLTGSVVASQ